MKTSALLVALLIARIAAGQSSGTVNYKEVFRHQGDDALSLGDFSGAIEFYEKAYEVGGGDDAQLLKRMAALHQWMRDYATAKELLGNVLERNPSDEEADIALRQLQNRRGLQLFGSYGEGEIDYTTRFYRLGAFYGGVDWLDLHAGFSQSSKPGYDRSEASVDAYLFPSYRLYFRFGLREKRYTYPHSRDFPPDDNAYTRVPDYQFEVGYYYVGENYVSLETEYYAPHFYWNNSLQAKNYKIGGTVRNWIVKPVYAKIFAATLHDPDPTSLSFDQVTNTITGFGYEDLTLIGGALGFDNERVSAEVKYVPDRDLDRSLDWSVFSTLRVNANGLSVQYDFLYDTYSSTSVKALSASQVHMLTTTVQPADLLELKVGMKMLVRGTTIVSPFVSLRLKTGV